MLFNLHFRYLSSSSNNLVLLCSMIILFHWVHKVSEGQLKWLIRLVNTMRLIVWVLTQLIHGSCGQSRVLEIYTRQRLITKWLCFKGFRHMRCYKLHGIESTCIVCLCVCISFSSQIELHYISTLVFYLMLGSLLQIRGMHTLIRDKEITKHDFVFYSDRLIRLVCCAFLYLRDN